MIHRKHRLVTAARNAHKQGLIEKQWKRKSPNFFVISAETKLNRMQDLARNAANSLNLCAARVAAKQASRQNFLTAALYAATLSTAATIQAQA